ncbi:hypothetical protein EMPS_03840 [Entomortierella parvispora]|uniref:F-box domain-containing protein n=1 Tax=Entomortierella parvispora TaxID=205924 RepID=A0A9P3H7G8_9FUNG|nr:hypothetical protein EMPS_03840 [Entomortierella parvispora]
MRHPHAPRIMTRAFDLPELTTLIAQFLPKENLLACIQVSRQWHHVFLPSLWQRIVLRDGDTIPTTTATDTVIQLHQHSDMIQSLRMPLACGLFYTNPASDFYSPVVSDILILPRLQELILSFAKSSRLMDDFRGARNFLLKNGHHLSSLEVSVMHEGRLDMSSLSFWGLFGGCKAPDNRLSKLRLEGVRMVIDELDEASRQMLMRLDTLRLKSVHFLPHFSGPETEWPRLPQWPQRLTGCKVKKLDVVECAPVLVAYRLIQDCQELRSLTWIYTEEPESVDLAPPLIQNLQAGLWPFLESLNLNINHLTDFRLAQLLEAVSPLKHLTLDISAFGDLSSIALLEAGSGKHSKRMETLSLSRCSALNGVMVQRFLCEMPHLKVLRANFLTQQNIEQDPRPWVCSQLEELRIAFLLEVLSTLDVRLMTNVILDRLEGLSQLRILEFGKLRRTGSIVSKTSNCVYMGLHLRYGLDRLKALSRLEELSLDEETEQDIGVKEAQWMVDNWPRLYTVRMRFASSCQKTKMAILDVFESQGMKKWWSGSCNLSRDG